ncbi:hypothetical protein PFDG_02508 [Plasmodium falciparum Dd2]|uniref:Rifin n=1 Tax=Plasmodium falciparum (isolate Dd2) TaxID=57267 RepID=A0A0L7M6M5_PLAF4|nr:hypothetical protein PFDG_02508 [Plasmodium falciparum Dd2]
MMLNYTNILLFYLSLNILSSSSEVYNQRNHYITRTPKATTRLLCECELYAPSNYDNDPEMKAVMQGFDRQTSQRFEEYNERLLENKQKCKDQCDKEIQKIILKDKLEKELMNKFATLQTDISINDIPTCVCEKSIADKVEKGCLRCGGVLGGGVAPSVGLLGGIGEAAISVLKPLAIEAAKKAAVTEATDAAIEAGMNAVRHEIKVYLADFINEKGFVDFTSVVNEANFKCPTALFQNAKELLSDSCIPDEVTKRTSVFCNSVIHYGGEATFKSYAEAGTTAYDAKFASETTALTEAKVGAVNATYGGYHVSIIASIVAIVKYY